VLRGLNVGGRSKMPPFVPFDLASDDELSPKADKMMAAVRQVGANAVRLTLSWEALEPQRGSYDAGYLARYRALLDAAQRQDLAVVVDFHQDVFQAAFCGDGFPEWALGSVPHGASHYDCGYPSWSLPYFDGSSPVNQAFDRLWNNTDGLLDDLERMWRDTARSLGDHPAVAAFEVINEPGSGSRDARDFAASTLPAIYARMATAIEASAGPSAIFGGDSATAATNDAYLQNPAYGNFVYAPHYYDPVIVTGGDAIDEAAIHAALAARLTAASAWPAPVVLGEFGAPNPSTVKEAYLKVVLDALDEFGASGFLWDASASDASWNDEDFSIFTADNAERDWAKVVDRPFPRAVDGVVSASQWDAVALRYELSVVAAGPQVSEIYLPRRQLGDLPHVTVVGATQWSFLAGESLLLVTGTAGTTWTLVADRP
jgi:endoglycosylceramidase